jgi:hypothetical protein
MRKAIILKEDYYFPIGTIATVKFFDKKPALVGDMFMFEDSCYKISGVIVSGSSDRIKDKFFEGIYDCRIVKVEKTDCA